MQTPVITNTPPVQLPAIAPVQAPGQAESEAQKRVTGAEPRAARPLSDAVDRHDFQDFVSQSTGQQLPLYGHNLFAAPSTFAPLQNVPVSQEYLIGPGDELLIRAWGQIDVDYRAVVDRNGAINIPRVGTVQVAGLRYADLTPYVKKEISRNFRNFELIVTLGQLRSVQVFVVGQARQPGSYTVSSLATLVNAIFAVGGPSP
ncbi:MAG: polysaccharide biosynthesis/export family protein, partial [Betaproteobacteria bacterium]|nr:polysaccharide biosynthesis/export family protein [Betaproteobacteria bacterium]